MDSHSTARRSRFRSSSPLKTMEEKALESIGPPEFSLAAKSTSDTSTRISDGTEHKFPLSSSSLPLNGRKWSPPLPETLHSENLDALMFEAMDSNLHNNKKTNSINSGSRVSRSRQVKSGRRFASRASAKEEVRRNDYSFQWSSANFDEFFSDSPRTFKDTSKKDKDDVAQQVRKWEPFRINVAGNGENRKNVDADIVYSFGSKENLDDEFGGSENCNGREKIDDEKSDTDVKNVNTWGFENQAVVFDGSQPKSNVKEKIQKFQTDSVYGEFQGLSHDVDHASAVERASSGHPSANRSQRSSLMINTSISSISDCSGRGFRWRVGDKENVKDNIFVRQSVSLGSSSATIPSVPIQDTNNQVTHGRLQARGEASVMSSSLGSTTIEDSSLQGNESLNNVDNSSSYLDIPFRFGAKKEVTKVQYDGRKPESKNVSSFNGDRAGYQSHGLERNPRDFSETTSNNIPFNNNAPNLEPSSMSFHFHFGFDQSDRHMSVKEAKKIATVNLQTDIEQQMNAANVSTAESPAEEYQFRYDKKDGGERPSFDQQRPFSSSGYNWLNSSFEKVRTDKCKGGTNGSIAIAGGSTQRGHTSETSSVQGSLASGFAGKGHRLVAEGSMKSSSSIDRFQSSPFSLQPVIFQTDAAQAYASGVKGDSFDSNQIAAKENNTIRFSDATSVPDSISTSCNQTSKSDLVAIPMAVNNAASEQACESWRHRGNQAYAEGEFSKAEEYYTRGISCVSPSETSENCIRALVLCYSNRAVTRMAVSRYREALSDCMRALNLDPNFMKARIRAASCHIAVGEYELALAFFKDCLRSQSESDIVDSKLASEALEGTRKTQQVEEKIDHAVRLLSTKKSEDISNSLCLVNEALTISPHSEKLLELKAQALLALRKYEEVIQACEEGLASVNQTHYCGISASENQIGNTDTYGAQCNCPIKLLLWQMTGKAQFYLGRLEEALASLLKYEEGNIATIKSCGHGMETTGPLIATIRDLVHHKATGNESFQAGNFVEAEKHYTAALSCNTESRPFTAVCFGNRAAASHAQGHIADAIADCSRAMALDTKYLKVISRRSILHEMIRNYGQAISDLQRLLTLQESEQQNVKGGSLTRTASSCNSALDLKGARERLAQAQVDLKRGIPLDHYLILGVEPSCTAAEIKKAYRKAALKHHPDKAAQFLVGSDGGDDELLKECVEEVRRDAEKLFQLIAEAYAILSDPAKRLQYDTEEELQKLRSTRGTATSTAEPGMQSKSSLSEKSSRQNRQGWNAWKEYENQYNHWDAWKDYENQYNHWRTHPEASRTDNSTRRGPVNTSEVVGWNDYNYCI